MTHLHDRVFRWYESVCGARKAGKLDDPIVHDTTKVDCLECLARMKDMKIRLTEGQQRLLLDNKPV